MTFVAELIGGPCDGNIAEVNGRPDCIFMPVSSIPRYYTDEVPKPSSIETLCYVKRVGLDGELRYVWNKLRP